MSGRDGPRAPPAPPPAPRPRSGLAALVPARHHREHREHRDLRPARRGAGGPRVGSTCRRGGAGRAPAPLAVRCGGAAAAASGRVPAASRGEVSEAPLAQRRLRPGGAGAARRARIPPPPRVRRRAPGGGGRRAGSAPVRPRFGVPGVSAPFPCCGRAGSAGRTSQELRCVTIPLPNKCSSPGESVWGLELPSSSVPPDSSVQHSGCLNSCNSVGACFGPS